MSRWLNLFFISALCVLGTTGCPPDPTTSSSCTPQTCPGCCQNGSCQVGNSPQACGTAGGLCIQCPVGQSCVNGICQQGAGNPCEGCPGCCLNGKCMSGTSPSACGPAAGSCSVCTAGQQCVNRSCQGITQDQCNPNTCAGCCHGGQCVTSPTDQQCGSGGRPCVPCAGTEQCDRGQCVEKSNECSVDNCPGCCWNNQCHAGNVPNSCGAGGAACDQCRPGESCENGSCRAPTTTSCSWENCFAGCCDNGRCHMPSNDQRCGIGGLQCRQCSYFEECKYFASCQRKDNGTGVQCGVQFCTDGNCCDNSTFHCRPQYQCTFNCTCGNTNMVPCPGSPEGFCRPGLCCNPYTRSCMLENQCPPGQPCNCGANNTIPCGNGQFCTQGQCCDYQRNRCVSPHQCGPQGCNCGGNNASTIPCPNSPQRYCANGQCCLNNGTCVTPQQCAGQVNCRCGNSTGFCGNEQCSGYNRCCDRKTNTCKNGGPNSAYCGTGGSDCLACGENSQTCANPNIPQCTGSTTSDCAHCDYNQCCDASGTCHYIEENAVQCGKPRQRCTTQCTFGATTGCDTKTGRCKQDSGACLGCNPGQCCLPDAGGNQCQTMTAGGPYCGPDRMPCQRCASGTTSGCDLNTRECRTVTGTPCPLGTECAAPFCCSKSGTCISEKDTDCGECIEDTDPLYGTTRRCAGENTKLCINAVTLRCDKVDDVCSDTHTGANRICVTLRAGVKTADSSDITAFTKDEMTVKWTGECPLEKLHKVHLQKVAVTVHSCALPGCTLCDPFGTCSNINMDRTGPVTITNCTNGLGAAQPGVKSLTLEVR